MKNALINKTALIKRTALSVALLSATAGLSQQVVASDDVNYGDPTASFSTLGVSRTNDASMINFQMGFGKNIIQFDYGFNDKQLSNNGTERRAEGNQNYRGRIFHVTDGLGFSATATGSINADGSRSDAVFAGALYKFAVSDNVMVFPMLDVGHQISKDANGNKSKTNIVQPGLYAMYAFDSGHWLYANPKMQYVVADKEWVSSAELGGGYMLTDNVSVGFRVDHTAKTDKKKEDTKFLLQANYYF